MENWLMFAIATIFISGFHNFTLKVAAERNYDVSLINIYSYVITAFFLFIYIFLDDGKLSFDNFNIILILGFLNSFLFSISMFSRVEAMKNIDAVIFFPLYKTFGPILVTIISLFFFRESLEFKEIIGIIIGISVPLLLITSSENKIQRNLFIGVLLTLITAILTAASSSASKEIMINGYDIVLYLLVGCIFGFFLSLISYNLLKKKKQKNIKHKGFFKFALISGILYSATHFSFMLALEGNLAVVFTIASFSILIPIILSIIFYKDHFNLKKGLVIALSIVSVLLFL